MNLYVDSKPSQNWICIDADMPYGHGIYFSSDENRIHEVLPQIRRICNTINNEVADEIAQYRILNNTIDRSLREFQRKLNIILYKTKLPLKKERLFIVKCRFIKADLEYVSILSFCSMRIVASLPNLLRLECESTSIPHTSHNNFGSLCFFSQYSFFYYLLVKAVIPPIIPSIEPIKKPPMPNKLTIDVTSIAIPHLPSLSGLL
jgi:hypothetical protein